MKTLVNNPETCVRENLEGYVAAHPGLKILDKFNVVLHEETDSEHGGQLVALISGGGSGHEPSQTGFVGPGMLTASVAGDIFASPSAITILNAIYAVQPKSSGILLIIPNYTGDCLNFGLALERARLKGIKIESVTVGEDCAFHDLTTRAGRRGLCGIIFIHKIAGALAAQGKSLDDVYRLTQEATKRLGTISVSLTPCNIPGRGPSFRLESDEIELGLGIHGEAGISRLKIMPAKEVVKVMFEHMVNAGSSSRLSLKAGDHVALLVNNLGALSQLEFNIVIKELLSLLESKSVVIDRMYSGTLNTSLDMAGISFSIFILNDIYKKCLDAPTKAPAWPKVFVPNKLMYKHALNDQEQILKVKDVAATTIEIAGPTLTPDIYKRVILAIQNACNEIIRAEEHLNFLDRESGDGDCGSTLRKGAEAILLEIKAGSISDRPRHIMQTLASVVENHMGGSSGAVYSLFFTGASAAFEADCNVSTWCRALQLGMDAVSKHGGAKPGDRTLLDVLHPAFQMLTKFAAGKEYDLGNISVGKMTKSLEEAANRTAKMKAKAGRASYVSSERLVNPDPGAHAAAIWLSSILKTFENYAG